MNRSIAVLALLAAACVAQAQEKVLLTFSGTGNGSRPQCRLVMDSHRNLYGVTPAGGDNGGGLVFELSPDGHGNWNAKTIYSFDSLASGLYPNGGLVLDSAGNLYGTTTGGGTFTLGTAFELSPTGSTWTETVLHSFGGTGDGIFPYAQMIFDSAGNLYGTTAYGGAHGTGEAGGGTVFELSPQIGGSWTEDILHNFAGGNGDGRLPEAGVTLDAAGNVYGTTSTGGPYERGMAFKLAPLGGGVWTFTGLHVFGNNLDGASPEGEVVLDASGNVYGTTYDGGANCESFGGCGTFYELSSVGTGWSETKTYSFGASDRDATFPQAGLIIDSLGNFYGTSNGGGEEGNGTVFEVKP